MLRAGLASKHAGVFARVRAGASPAGAILSCAAMLALYSTTAAQAQCTNNFSQPLALLVLPFSQGGSVNSLVSVINSVNTAFLTNTSALVSAPGNPLPDQQGGGVWGRAIGGTVETKATGVTVVDSSTSLVLGPTTGAQTCNTTTRQDFAGFQVGKDISVLNAASSGANWHLGVTAGYFEANAKDTSPGGTFGGNFQVPFAGIYTTFTKGNFFADALARWDLYQNNITDGANGLFGQNFDAHGFSLTGGLGYRFDLPAHWFIEPSAGVVWSRVNVDPINTSGTFLLFTGFALPGTVQIEDVESLLGRASVRVGTNFTSGNVALQPFVTASILHEYAGDVTSRFRTADLLPINALLGGFVSATQTTSRVGTYAQIGVGSAFQLINTGWLGYARVDFRTGENIEGVSVNVGLRYQFSPEQRGDLKDGHAATAWQDYNWTGFYLGGFAGRTWGTEHQSFVGIGTSVTPAFGGHFVGGQAGYNHQIGRIVVGLEGDFGTSNAHGGKSCPNQFFFTCEAGVDDLGSLTVRLGYTSGRALYYAKGGWAFADVTAGSSLNAPVQPSPVGLSSTNIMSGWTFGGGAEFALTETWSARAEYMHYDLGSDRFLVAEPPTFVDAFPRGDNVRVGVNYHFGHQ
jgi:opacity protein-like surface antigen